MPTPQLHLLMPTFNRGHRLRSTLDNIYEQNAALSLWKLTVVDNASTDDTQALLAGFRATKPNFDYVVNERNVGLYGNMNRCMDLASTDKFMVIHSDDWVSADLVTYALRQIGLAPGAHLYFGPSQARIVETGELIENWYSSRVFLDRELDLTPREFLRAMFLSGTNCIFPPTVIYDRAFFGNRLRYGAEYRWTSDLDLWYRVGLAGARVRYYPRPLIICGIHDQRMSAFHARDMRLEYVAIVRKYLRFLAVSGRTDVLTKAEARLIAAKALTYRIVVGLNLVPGFRLRRKIAKGFECLFA